MHYKKCAIHFTSFLIEEYLACQSSYCVHSADFCLSIIDYDDQGTQQAGILHSCNRKAIQECTPSANSIGYKIVEKKRPPSSS